MMVGSDKQRALQIYIPLVVYMLLLLFPILLDEHCIVEAHFRHL